jgi:hypothetical protein
MSSFRRLALVLALGLPAAHFVYAQSSSSSSNPTPAAPEAQQTPANSNSGALSVQARIRERREKRRAQAIHDVYSHGYEVFGGMGMVRFVPGSGLQRTSFYAWDAGFTRYYSQRLGVTIDGRGYYGTTFIGPNPYSINKPAISAYTAMAGPTYRFYMQPKYSISGRVMGGYAKGNFSSDTNGFGSKSVGIWPDGNTYAINAGALVEYNLSPAIGLRIGPDYMLTGFGSTTQNSLGFTGGVVFRFGKQ